MTISEIPENVLAKIEFEPNSGCWLWSGSLTLGYAQGYHDGRHTSQIHRVLYELFSGSVAKDKHLHHRCETKCCVNPNHMEEVTVTEHMARHLKTHCKHGHPFNDANTYWLGARRTRVCRKCRDESTRQWKSRQAKPAREPIARRRNTRCRHGHPYSGQNLRIDSKGNQRCRTCWNEWMNKYYHKRKLVDDSA